MDATEFDADETALERFARLYMTQEETIKHWDVWMSTQTETTQAVMAKMAATVAEDNDITVDEAKQFLCVQKVIEDVGVGWVENWLDAYDKEQFMATRTLKPMTAIRKRR
jgi:hypothetical protein